MRALGVRLLRAPVLHFVALGGALWWLTAATTTPVAAARPRVVITADDVVRLRDEWTAVHGAAPGPATRASIVADAVDEEILFREALALGLDRRDAAVRERLRRLEGFVGEDLGDERALEREARALGLQRSDLVVRRHLVALMRLALHRVGPAEFPTDAELERWVAAHADTFAVAPRVRLTHVYLGRDRRGAALEHDAEALLAELQQEGVGPDTAARYGDAFVRGADVGPASSGDVDRIFGPGFAAAITDAPVGRWVGPVRSTYGLHLVWIREREAGGLPPLAAVRGRALHGWLVERGAQRAEERMAALRSRYDVDVEEP